MVLVIMSVHDDKGSRVSVFGRGVGEKESGVQQAIAAVRVVSSCADCEEEEQ